MNYEHQETASNRHILIQNLIQIIELFNVPDKSGISPCRGIGYGVLESFIESFIVSNLPNSIYRYQKAYKTSLQKYIENECHFKDDVDHPSINNIRNQIKKICKVI